jgi:hypothetical protein
MAEPEVEWSGAGPLRTQIAEWIRQRGKSPRLYPGSLVWCLKKPGRDLREKVEQWLDWKRVAREVADGTLGGEFDKGDRDELQTTSRPVKVSPGTRSGVATASRSSRTPRSRTGSR